MKKVFLVVALVIMAMLTTSIVFASQPDCPEGQSYIGEYVETESCHNVCTFRLFGFCLNWKNVCETTGSWVGSCQANEIDEPEEPEVIEPVIFSDNLWVILANQCKSVEYTEWSECNELFNLQYRTIIRPENGCTPTSQQQVDQQRVCE